MKYIRLPLPIVPSLTYTQKHALRLRLQRLRLERRLTASQLALGNLLIWHITPPDSGAIELSYSELQQRTGQSRDSIARGIRALEREAIVVGQRRRVTVSWHNGGRQSRQATTIYQLLPCGRHESDGQTVLKGLKIFSVSAAPDRSTEAAQQANTQLAAARQRQFERDWLARRHPQPRSTPWRAPDSALRTPHPT